MGQALPSIDAVVLQFLTPRLRLISGVFYIGVGDHFDDDAASVSAEQRHRGSDRITAMISSTVGGSAG
jgi:hypothetical protein